MTVNFLFSALRITQSDAPMVHFDKFQEIFKDNYIDTDEAYLSNFRADIAR